MADQEKVTRLKSISDVDAWVTQFTIDLEDRKPELAKMLTKTGWETLPDATKERTTYSSEEIKAVEFNKAAHKKIIKAMGLHKDLINMVQTKTSEKAPDGCAWTAMEYIRTQLGETANNDLGDLEDEFDAISLDDSIQNPLKAINQLESIANDANNNHGGQFTDAQVMRKALRILPSDKYETIIDKFRDEGNYGTDQLRKLKKKVKTRYRNKLHQWREEKKGRKKKNKKRGSLKDDSSTSSSEDKREYVGQIMNMLSKNIASQTQQQQYNSARPYQRPLLAPNTNLNPNTTRGTQRNPTCNNCGEQGHIARNCPNGKSRCSLCGGLGHMTDKCWENDTNARFRPENWVSKLTLPCPICKQAGHYAKDCPMKQLQTNGQNAIPGLHQTVGMVSHQDIINALDSLAFGQPTQFKKSKTKSKRDSTISLSEVSSISDNNIDDSDESEESNEFCGMIQVSCTICPTNGQRSEPKRVQNHRKPQTSSTTWTQVPTLRNDDLPCQVTEPNYPTTDMPTENYYSCLDDDDSTFDAENVDLLPDNCFAYTNMNVPIGQHIPIPTHTMIIPLINVIQHYKQGSYLNGDFITLANTDPILHVTYTEENGFHDIQLPPSQ